MRTTIDIPEDLLRRAKATAALRGMKMKDLVAEILSAGLADFSRVDTKRTGQHRPIPVTILNTGGAIPSLTGAEIDEVFLKEDLERLGLDRSS